MTSGLACLARLPEYGPGVLGDEMRIISMRSQPSQSGAHMDLSLSISEEWLRLLVVLVWMVIGTHKRVAKKLPPKK